MGSYTTKSGYLWLLFRCRRCGDPLETAINAIVTTRSCATGFAQPLLSAKNPTWADAHAILFGLYFTHTCEFRHVILESDSYILVSKLNSTNLDLTLLSQEAHSFIYLFDFSSFQYEGNHAADRLGRLGLARFDELCFDLDCPSKVHEIVIHDI
ncbi:hypothetical protein Gohar_019846 [Gossypium harknessii]|uniref:RNase H type-1 domain-containing protein n=1 Tax=Gossypium harknessii TaxID=34285 RepID=A0A7J9HYL9_9ROSI|nr:hypothetical protein [Gossypium harknessii]